MEQKKSCKMCKGKCSTLYCGECAYLDYNKRDYSYYYCHYWEMYTRKPENVACDNFKRR